jgi:hypothetical protein
LNGNGESVSSIDMMSLIKKVRNFDLNLIPILMKNSQNYRKDLLFKKFNTYLEQGGV